MKNIKSLAVTAVLGLLAASASNVQASAEPEFAQTINYKLTIRTSTNWSTGNIQKSKIMSAKVTTKDILELLGEATTNDFTGAALVLINFGDGGVQVRQGTNVLADVTGFFNEESEDDVFIGTYDDDTGKDSYKGYWPQTIAFDDGRGNSFTFIGLVTESYSASAANDDDVRKISDTATLNGTGNGETADGDYFVATGSITTKGKGTDIWN
jgi:hypothetical protein